MLHQGSPAQINAEFFREKLAVAKLKRADLLATDTNGYRLIHGENDGFPGLIIDVYAGVAVVKLYSPAWLPWLTELTPLMVEAAGASSIVLRLSRNTGAAAGAMELEDGAVLHGTLSDPVVVFREHGLQFSADVVAGHKTGFFLDHRDNRRRIGTMAQGREVLDVFSYAGGFSVHALAGGAAAVTSLDISAPALEQARSNARLNGLDLTHHKTMAEDAFVALEQLARSERVFDIVIVDPPSFAKSDKEIPGALAAYRRINKLALPLVAPGGVLLAASCSARVSADDFFRTVEAVLHASGRGFKLLDKTYHDIDHPIGFPEGAYLKSGYYRMN